MEAEGDIDGMISALDVREALFDNLCVNVIEWSFSERLRCSYSWGLYVVQITVLSPTFQTKLTPQYPTARKSKQKDG